MSTESVFDPFDENLRKLLAAAAEEPQPFVATRLIPSVLQEVRTQRSRKHWRRRVAFSIAAAAAVALIVGGITMLRRPLTAPSPVAQVETLYGIVTLSDGNNVRSLNNAGSLHADEWLQTHCGSEAAVTLGDGSRIVLRPRSRLQVQEGKDNVRLRLREGSIGVEAHKQPPGRRLRIETPAAQIEVVGTRLDVRTVERPDGTLQTRVAVASGEVTMESARKAIVIRANNEGIADEGKPPERRSLTDEVNELVRLIERARTLAAESRVPTGPPAIVDFNVDGTATLWTVASIQNKGAQTLRECVLRSQYALFGAQAFTLEGAPVPVAADGNELHFDLSGCSLKPGATANVILKLPGVTGLFTAKETGVFQFSCPTNSSAALSLIQFRLPGCARLEESLPAPIEIRRAMSRLIITLSSRCTLPNLAGPVE